MKNFIYIHVYLVNNWYKILEEQLEKIRKSGLLDISNVKIVAVKDKSDMSETILNLLITKYPNVQIDSIHSNTACGECVTIKKMKSFVDNLEDSEINILYLHSKGVTQYGSVRDKPVTQWRKMMEYFLIEKWEDCIEKLNLGYDCCGVNYQDHAATIDGERKSIKIVNGNFFWAKSSYIKNINPNFKFASRYCPENWLLSINHNIYVPNNDFANVDLYHNTIKDFI